MPHKLDPALQREAARAALEATIDTLFDLAIEPAIIIEMLACMCTGLSQRQAIRYAAARTGNDRAESPADDQ